MGARIKIKGYQDFIKVSTEKGKEINRIYNDAVFQNDEKIKLENATIRKGDIVAVFIDEEQRDSGAETMSRMLSEYYTGRMNLLALTPEQRARTSGWSYFRLAYSGLRGNLPNESMKDEWLDFLTEFYKNNPKWSKPSLFLSVFPFLKIEKEDKTTMSSTILRILERVEGQELHDIQHEEDYRRHRIEFEEKDINGSMFNEKNNTLEREIRQEDLPF